MNKFLNNMSIRSHMLLSVSLFIITLFASMYQAHQSIGANVEFAAAGIELLRNDGAEGIRDWIDIAEPARAGGHLRRRRKEPAEEDKHWVDCAAQAAVGSGALGVHAASVSGRARIK